ncbi:hypothetical protein [Aureimonas populi]|uniref:Uncharacterized protein n=1 Tax=Aureimonas populi TaxID=1701758 RepID=A0ABW5CG61_9HYPH|nr:hypothetical protein [Aureimonas populi]
MNWRSLFRCKPDPIREAQQRHEERTIERERGNLRNQIQSIHSHSRRLTVMAGTLALKGSYDDESR